MGAFFRELFRANLYKRTQGRVSRQITFFTIVIVLAFGVYRAGQFTDGFSFLVDSINSLFMAEGATLSAAMALLVHIVFSLLVLGIGAWIAFRAVNLPVFADFLIAVQAEMTKVSWPARTELKRASLVVLVLIFMLAGVIFLFDTVFAYIARGIGVM